MPELSRPQLLVYAAIAVAVLLAGARWIRTSSAPAASSSGAGGLNRGAAEDAINLAARLSDGQQVVVPGRGARVAAAGGEGPVSLGTATVEQLDELDGIGPVTAQDIIDFRDQHGGLSSIDQLDQISGIGPSTMESLRAGLQP